MTKKSTSPKTQVNIKGNVSGQTVIFGDQYNYNFQQQVAQIQSPQEFVAKLQELHSELTQIKQQPDLPPEHKETLEIVEGDVAEVIEEAKEAATQIGPH